MVLQEYENLKNIYETEGKSTIIDILKGTAQYRIVKNELMIALAYVLYRARDEKVDISTVETFRDTAAVDNDRISFLEAWVGDCWSSLNTLRYKYNTTVLKSIIVCYEDESFEWKSQHTTPPSLIKLAQKILDIKENDKLADFGIGSAEFVIDTFLHYPNVIFNGIDINPSVIECAAIKLDVLGCPIRLENRNILDIDIENKKYNKIFANYPFGLRTRDLGVKYCDLNKKITKNTKTISSDWLFNFAIMESLNERGMAVAIMTNGSTWNTMDRSAREYFVENGFIKAVIALPERMFETTNIPTTMVVLSFNNENTMLVDASGVCVTGRRNNSFSAENIDEILGAISNQSEHSYLASKAELKENDYVINPTRYLTEKVVVDNGVKFSSVIKRITRGAPLKADELDMMVSNKPTNYQYLMLSNIQKGQIDTELPYLTGIDEKLEKYCINNHSLIISKNGAPFKIAVAEFDNETTVLANGNLFIIEIDEEKADPYFIKAFLESEKGTAILKSITVGATIPNIGVESLKNIDVPVLPIEKQHAIVIEYRAKMDEILVCQRKLQKLNSELTHFFDNKAW